MSQTEIQNPILNSPFEEPRYHFRFDEQGITDEIIEGRRNSIYRMPIPLPKKRGKSADQGELAIGGTSLLETEQEIHLVNQIRPLIAAWRKQGYANPAPTSISQRLLEYWTDPSQRYPRLYFCQIEAIETIIFLAEVAPKIGRHDLLESIRDANREFNPELPIRIALKMATGSGKTLVMAMLIAWQTLNRQTYTNDKRFCDRFLIVTPGITIKDRLRVLYPTDPENYYTKWNLVPDTLRSLLNRARVHVVNYHQFRLQETMKTSALVKEVLTKGDKSDPLKETPDDMVRRVTSDLGRGKEILVINDEAHHCYLPKELASGELSKEDKTEATVDRKRAALWISGLTSIRKKLGIKTVYDLSATPFTLRGSGYGEGNVFPWVVSDFSLVDAVESGIVKVPRVPVADNTSLDEMPMYRHIWPRIKDDLPIFGRSKGKLEPGEHTLPIVLEGALRSLYGNYSQYYKLWEKSVTEHGESPPPVFIVVCNNTNVSKMVYEFIAGWEKPEIVHADGSPLVVPGKLELFSNVENQRWRARPYTILIDSEQLESDDAMSDDFKKIAKLEIETFKRERNERFPENSAKEITDQQLLREVLNTVGKSGRLGEHVRCVVSVSMLTEGWDATTVSHIVGVRAFGTQLLCEQVVGRGLRRRSHLTSKRTFQVHGKEVTVESFAPEYAEVYGVPFNFARITGGSAPSIPVKLYHVKALPQRSQSEIIYPNVVGYRFEWPRENLEAKFTNSSYMTLSPGDVATQTIVSSVIGENEVHYLSGAMDARKQEVVYKIAQYILHTHYRSDENGIQPWFMPDLVKIVREWIEKGYVIKKDDTFLSMLLMDEYKVEAAEKIKMAIQQRYAGEKRLLPILHQFKQSGSTRYVNFQTAKEVTATGDKSHVNYVVADSGWESKVAESLESMDEVLAYVKNEGLCFTIPYIIGGRERHYYPDFIVRLNDGKPDPLNLIIEVTGSPFKAKATKTSTAEELWLPAINNHGGFGRWGFLEVTDPFNLKNTVRAYLEEKENGC